jgi:geranylgeranyl diphosphate synthase, type I
VAALSASLPAVIARHRETVEAALREALALDGSPLTGPARYVMGWQAADGTPMESGGKRIRPALTIVAAEIFGGTASQALPGAVAVELIHNFSLVHDEIQDQDDVRHGRPTAYTVWGPGQAINLGDFMYGRALQALTRGAGDVSRRMAALDVLLRAIEGMIGGQWRDIAFEEREHVSVEEYLGMVEGKTGVLLGAALEMGAILGGAPADQSALMGRWGTRLGLAFQAIDDYLGIWGDEALTGKTTTGDIARKKKTLPIIHGLNDSSAGPLIRGAFAADRQVELLPEIVTGLEAAGANALCSELARKFADEAEAMATELAVDASGREMLRAVGDYFCSRTF